ncbi:hypothetical protein BV898_01894 [Hypsibius exemplaris]|uniref:Reverse transcriptase domain-containing protein n=1 Tax=Hypsibius exemplaris TaxID=2072580 RepID=A0A1W0XA04_HYPEX|nr:hypothetical protein BV898_01894 [Hypsibius exemplaris]
MEECNGGEGGGIECLEDDTTVYCVTKTPEGAVKGLNKLLESVSKRFADHHLALNEKKCVDSIRYLGVTIDRLLTWADQYANVRRNVKTGNALIEHVKDGLATEERVNLLHAFLGLHLNYCALVWSSPSDTLRSSLQVAQRNVVRSVKGYKSAESATDFMDRMNITPIEKRGIQLGCTGG